MNEPIYLRDAMLAEAEAVGLRLRACVQEALIRSFDEIPTAHELAMQTGLDGVVCKRVVKLLRDGPGAIVLTHAPSVSNLREFSMALETRMDLGPMESFTLRDAIGKFEKLLQAFGGSKGDLTKILRSTQSGERSVQPVRSLEYAVMDDDGRIRAEGGTGEAVARFITLNPLEFDAQTLATRLIGAAEGGTVVTWSGNHADELFARDPSVWTGDGLETLGRLCREVAPALRAAGVRWLLRPHCRHVLCDTQRCVNFLRTQVSGAPVREVIGLALDPVAMLEASMLDSSGGAGATPADYVGRAIRTLGPASELVFVCGVEAPQTDEIEDFEAAPLPQRCPADAGIIGLEPLVHAIDSARPFIGRMVMEGADATRQISLFRQRLGADGTGDADYTTPTPNPSFPHTER